jgi:hypothetical protein
MSNHRTLKIIAVSVALFVGLSASMDTHRLRRSSFPPPIDPNAAPTDLTLLTRGSSWRCQLVRAGGTLTDAVTDFRFSSTHLGSRWESFTQENSGPAYFDLDHASGIDQYFAGTYAAGASGKLQLMTDLAGMTAKFSHVTPEKEEDMRRMHDPWLRGEIRLDRNAWSGVFEEITVRSLSNDEMSIVVETKDTPTLLLDQRCRRVKEPSYDPAGSLALLKE